MRAASTAAPSTASPMANPACRFAHTTITGTIRRQRSSMASLTTTGSSTMLKTCGRTDQIDVALESAIAKRTVRVTMSPRISRQTSAQATTTKIAQAVVSRGRPPIAKTA